MFYALTSLAELLFLVKAFQKFPRIGVQLDFLALRIFMLYIVFLENPSCVFSKTNRGGKAVPAPSGLRLLKQPVHDQVSAVDWGYKSIVSCIFTTLHQTWER